MSENVLESKDYSKDFGESDVGADGFSESDVRLS